ncbi:MAG: NADH-quinone oxidoreductase subunit D [endosymbiont of Seepiophila jonesi]|uniref:NADH-quinone oxidoreductase subunit D n=1 Tax=endosymbiont of Lamellibrachia luymesi TaxID=2200907 RepID=A0A370DW55_9GAMM|nr:MAG: NADH-quinone oxidoreductase subunit D [endosymbiont of Lamellibrachia luymesi]RDH94244.1 MAG: NADH-quinone oxidoreductase subunit D [endosymbiont of Seepiophila jonesi]
MRPENYQAISHPPSNEYELNFGPNHPGIEGNYALKVKLHGDVVVAARADGGYLHRGFEKLMEGRLWIQNIALVPRICVPDPVPMEVCYSMAVEVLNDMEVPERAQWLRVLQLELSRIAAHLFTFGGHAATTGMYTTMYWGVADRDQILDLFEEWTGGRVYHIYNIPGGVRRDMPTGFLDRVSRTMDYIESRLPDYDNLFFTNQVFVGRAKDTGPMNQQQALEWGVTGPNLRATGLAFDVRRDDPYLVYDQIDFDIPTEAPGDAWARTLVRRQELKQSIHIVRQVVEKLPSVSGPVRTQIPNPLAWNVPAGETYTRVESSKGELGYYVVSDGGDKPHRVHVRGPSSMHAVQVLEQLAVGARLEDVAQIMFSLDACPPEVDR